MVNIICVFVGEQRLICARVGKVDLVSELQRQIHALLALDHCCVKDLRIFLAEKKGRREWFTKKEEAVTALRQGRVPSDLFRKLYLLKRNLLKPNERIQDFLTEDWTDEPSDDIHIFATALSRPSSLLAQSRSSSSPPVDEAKPGVEPKQPLEVVVLRRNCNFPGCTKKRKSGGFCIRHGGGKRCAAAGCEKAAQKGGFCRGHGGGSRCKMLDCKKSVISGGFCCGHGGGRRCASIGCKKSAQRGGFCCGHGGVAYCKFLNCSKHAKRGGFCVSHGGGKRCASLGCEKTARNGASAPSMPVARTAERLGEVVEE